MEGRGKILVTGPSGFIGQSLVRDLIRKGREVVILSRNVNSVLQDTNIESLIVDDIVDFKNSKLLEGVDGIVHLAGLAHSKIQEDSDRETDYMRANRDATAVLAEAAARAGVRRFVLLSSIGVLGNTSGEGVFDDNTATAPYNAYTRSKLAAERVLWDVVQKTKLEGVVLRSPLVYGPGAKGSLSTLITMLRRGLPLPLGAIQNRRSLIGVANLVDLMQRCIVSPNAAGETYVVSDREVISTTDLIRILAEVTNSNVLLIPVPSSLLRLIARLLGKASLVEKLINNLEIDSSRVRNQLDWEQPYTFEQGMMTLGCGLDKNS